MLILQNFIKTAITLFGVALCYNEKQSYPETVLLPCNSGIQGIQTSEKRGSTLSMVIVVPVYLPSYKYFKANSKISLLNIDN